MATYREIKGVTVQTRDTDPNLPGVPGATWASGGNLNTARGRTAGGGTQTAAITTGGSAGPGYTRQAVTEQYNGSSWTEVGDLNTARSLQGDCGLYTSAIVAGGAISSPSPPVTTDVESWDGSSWTETTNINTARNPGGTVSESNTASLIFGGFAAPPRNAETELWNGSSWTEKNDMNQSKDEMASAGTTTAALGAGGTPVKANVELWDGTSWTETTDLNTAKTGAVGAGTQTSAIVFGGSTPPYVATTEFWNGSSWTEVADLSTARFLASPAGNSSSALMAGGDPSSTVIGSVTTEEWTTASSPVLVEGMIFLSGNTTLKGFGKAAGIPSATWSSGGNLNTARNNLMASIRGLQTDTIVFGSGGGSAATENYNGSSWTEVSDLNTGRGQGGGAGTATAALAVGGYTGSTRVANTESWNGSSWTEVNDLNQGNRSGLDSFGLQTSAIAGGGAVPPSTIYNNVESWDGTSWTEIAEINTARYGLASVGTSTAGFFTGGETSLGTPGITGKTEKWDGSSWTESGDLNRTRYSFSGGAGETNSGLVFGGYVHSPGILANTELFNGTSWTELNDLSEAVYDHAQMGSASAALKAGGNDGSSTAATEEWTANATLADITVS